MFYVCVFSIPFFSCARQSITNDECVSVQRIFIYFLARVFFFQCCCCCCSTLSHCLKSAKTYWDKVWVDDCHNTRTGRLPNEVNSDSVCVLVSLSIVRTNENEYNTALCAAKQKLRNLHISYHFFFSLSLALFLHCCLFWRTSKMRWRKKNYHMPSNFECFLHTICNEFFLFSGVYFDRENVISPRRKNNQTNVWV